MAPHRSRDRETQAQSYSQMFLLTRSLPARRKIRKTAQSDAIAAHAGNYGGIKQCLEFLAVAVSSRCSRKFIAHGRVQVDLVQAVRKMTYETAEAIGGC